MTGALLVLSLLAPAQGCCSGHTTIGSCCSRARADVKGKPTGPKHVIRDCNESASETCGCPCNAPTERVEENDTCEWISFDKTVWVDPWWVEIARDFGVQITEITVDLDKVKVVGTPVKVRKTVRTSEKRYETRKIVEPGRCSCNASFASAVRILIKEEVAIADSEFDAARYKQLKDEIEEKLRVYAEIEYRLQRISWNSARLIDGGMDRGGASREQIVEQIVADQARIKELTEVFCKNLKMLKEMGYRVSEEWLKRFCPEEASGPQEPVEEGKPHSTVPRERIRPIIDAPAFDAADAVVGVLPNARRIKFYTPSADFDAADDMVMILKDDRTEPIDGVAVASGGPKSDEPAIDVPVEALAGALAGFLIGAGNDEGGGPAYNVSFDGKPGQPAADTAIQNIQGADGSPTTLQAFHGRTPPLSVDTSGLDPDDIIAFGRRPSGSSDEPVTAGKLKTDLVVVQEDDAGRTLLETYFGRIEGEGLGSLPPDEAVVGVIDGSTGHWKMETITPLSAVMNAPEGAALTGTFRPWLNVDPAQVPVGRQFNVAATPNQRKQMAQAMNTTENSLSYMLWTDLFLRGKLIDSQRFPGTARGDGTALESDGGAVPVSGKYRIEKSADAVKGVEAEYERISKEAAPALEALPKGLQRGLRANLDRSRLYATELVSP